MNEPVTESTLREKCGIPTAEQARETALVKMVLRETRRTAIRKIEKLTSEIRLLSILIAACFAIGVLLATLNAYIGATIAISATLIPGIAMMIRIDRRATLNRAIGSQK